MRRTLFVRVAGMPGVCRLRRILRRLVRRLLGSSFGGRLVALNGRVEISVQGLRFHSLETRARLAPHWTKIKIESPVNLPADAEDARVRVGHARVNEID